MAYVFRTVTKAEIASFFETHPQGSFAQSIAMAEVRYDSGREIHYVAVFDGKSIVAGAQISIITSRVRTADITAGPLLDYNNAEIITSFTTGLRAYLRTLGCVFLTITPYTAYQESAITLLKTLGWHYSGRLDGHATGIRGSIRWIYIKNLAGQTLQNYRDAYAKRHRRYIKNHDPRLTIRTLKYDELPLFMKIIEQTAERRHFSGRSEAYFKSIYTHFKNNATFLIAELDHTIPVAGILFIESNDEIVSYLGGSIAEYAQYRGTYLLHDHMIRIAIEKGHQRYNFYGIEGKINDTSSEGFGIYEFKARFGTGLPIELIGEFTLPIRPLAYFAYKLLKAVRR